VKTKEIETRIISFLKKFWIIAKPYLQMILSKIKLWKDKHTALYKRSPWYKKVLIIIADFIVLFLFYLLIVDMNLFWLFGKSPGLSSVSHPKQTYATELYSADGVLIGKFFTENRTPVSFKEISPLLIKTLIYTEDERFYKHFGIDFQGVLAAAKDMTKGEARGASTITQQLVKNLFKTRSQYSTGLMGLIPGVRLIIMKTKEWITAVKIEIFYTKNEILTLYLNTVDFGCNAYGIKTACKTYFRTTPMKLTIEQAATLVGLLKATTTYNPKINPKNSLKRRNVVLENLLSHGVITAAQFDSIKNIPIKLNYTEEKYSDGQALYFKEAVVADLKEWCEQNNIDLYADGLKIYTTLDTRMQKYAEEAVQMQMKRVQQQFDNHWGKVNPWQDENHVEIKGFIESLAKKTQLYKCLAERFPNRPDSIDYFMNLPHKLKVFDYKNGFKEVTMSTMDSIRYMVRFMHCGFIAMEPETGYIKSWVGDINYDFWQYDKVLSKRQPGSTFKLFVYAEAFNKGLGPCDIRVDQPVQWDLSEYGEPGIWEPTNASATFSGASMTLKYAFARSVNSVAVQVAQEIGIPGIVRTAHAMGINSDLEEMPSVSLGSSDVSLLELVNSYCTVINNGKVHKPVLVTRVEDNEGNVIYKNDPEQKQVLPYETAFLMTQMLLAGMTEPGATTQNLWSYDLFKYNTDFGGKTGTSSNHSDAWFIGVTPNLVGGSWVGGEYRSIHFRTGNLGEGSRTALPVFGYFMERVLADNRLSIYRAKFPKPRQEIKTPYMCQTAWPKAERDSTLSDSTFVDSTSTIIANEGVVAN
jgi:penicillin-binding protein 1A